MQNIIFFIPKKTNYPCGIEKVALLIKEKLSNSKKLNLKEINLNAPKNLNPIFQKIIILIKFLFIGIQIRKYNRFDIFFSMTARLPFFISRNTKKVIFVHDLVYLKFPKSMSFFGFYADKFFVPISIKNSDIIFCPSNSTAIDIKKFFPNQFHKVKVVKLASTLDKKVTPKNNYQEIKKPYFLCLGTIEPRKNHVNLLKAFSKLSLQVRKKYSLLIIGKKGWGNIDLINQISYLGLENQIHIKDYVDNEYLNFLIKNSFCLVYPSFYEGFGLPILEAQNFGIPVITSKASSMPEVAGEGAIYVDPFSSVSIKKGLDKMIKNKILREFISNKAFENANFYSWEKTGANILEYLTEK